MSQTFYVHRTRAYLGSKQRNVLPKRIIVALQQSGPLSGACSISFAKKYSRRQPEYSHNPGARNLGPLFSLDVRKSRSIQLTVAGQTQPGRAGRNKKQAIGRAVFTSRMSHGPEPKPPPSPQPEPKPANPKPIPSVQVLVSPW
jgi:hypothetical protein